MYKILISGYYGFNNIGDEAVLRTVVENLRAGFDDIDLTILSQNPADTEEKHHVHAVPRMKFGKIVRAVRNCDMLISGGGSLLQDVTSRFSILYYLFIIFLALLFRKKVFIYSQGIGPIRSGFNRRLTSLLLRRADGICVRDLASAELLRSMKIPDELIRVTADPVIRLERTSPDAGRTILNGVGWQRQEGRLLVGWALKSPRTAEDKARFLEETARSIRYLKEHCNADSVLIPFHYEQDLDLIHTLSERLGNDVYAITDKHLSDEMLSIIGNLDVLVGVRLHSLIYSCVMGVPCIGISYDPKIDAFLKSIGGEAVSSIDEFTLERFRPAFEEVLERREEILDRTSAHVEKLVESLGENDALLRRIMDQSAAPKRERGAGGAIGGVMLISVLARLIGILRESFQANAFGSADQYYSAYNKTIYLFTTAGYALSVAAVPIITQHMAADRKKGVRAADNLTSFSLLLSLIAAAVWELITLPPLSGIFFKGAPAELLQYMRIMTLSLPVIACAYLMVATYQAMGHYALQGSMSIPYSVFLIGFLMIFGKSGNLLLYVIAVAAGWLLQLGMSVPYALKERYRWRFRLDLSQRYIGTYLKTVGVTIITGAMYLFCYLTDASFTARLAGGTTSAFYYADKLFTPLTTTFIYSISAVIFPKFNRQYTGTDHRAYKTYVWTVASNTLLVVFPMCAMLMVFCRQIISVLFQSGSFTADATAQTAGIFMMYAIGMAGFSLIDLLNKAFFTMEKVGVPLAISLCIIGGNFLLDSAFGAGDRMLALTTSIAMTAGAAVTILALFRKDRELVDLRPALKSLVASAVMGAAALGLRELVLNGSEGKIMLVIKCGAIGVVGLAVYVAMCYLLRLRELTDVLKKRKKG